MVKVMILCGGKGTRIREETEFRPKPLVEIGGLPILWHIMKHYEANGFHEFVLCLGYKGRMIKEFFMEYEWDSFDYTVKLKEKDHAYHRVHEIEDWTITFAETGEETNTGGRVKIAGQYIPKQDKYFLLTYGDGVSNVDLKALIKFHEKHGKLVTLTGVHPPHRFGALEVDKDHLVRSFHEKPQHNDFVNGGFMVVDRSLLGQIQDNATFEVDVLPKLAAQGQLAMFPHEGFWHMMDTHKDYLDLNKLWKTGAPWKTWEHRQRER